MSSYVNPFSCRQTVSAHLLTCIEDPKALTLAVHDELVQAMVDYAHNHGFPFFDIRAIKVVEKPYDPTLDAYLWEAKWFPPEEWPCEFVGGPLDGELRYLGKDRKARVVLPVMVFDDATFPPTSGMVPVEYRIAGINPVSNRWVYIPTAAG